ncbi:hypothetical protein M231_01340 [Tremella mesenterica]|uniref:Uncharacterized protein n=1 Tax=Tremella mesenterica TaxID=5217 RepID=A0A4Q1BTM7_TREME|nr:hypothetical protein M231_01340 [Tremella mesenterica]
MPQPSIQLKKYLCTPLPTLREQYPPGTGGTGPRAEWPQGTLKGVQVIDGFVDGVREYIDQLPTDPVAPHPAHKYPKFVQAITTVPQTLRSPSDLQKCLSTLPLAAVSTVLTALEVDQKAVPAVPVAQALDSAGYESDGGEESETHAQTVKDDKTKAWHWRYNKSPLGSGEFLLVQEGTQEVKLVVRTINSSAFTPADWAEFVVTGKYHYVTKNKASWYWSRTWGACNRLKCKYWILTDWQRWSFGCFDDALEHGWVSPVMAYDAVEPSVLQTIFYWAKTSMGQTPFQSSKKNLLGTTELFPANPARRVSVSGRSPEMNAAATLRAASGSHVKVANESDIEESDAE